MTNDKPHRTALAEQLEQTRRDAGLSQRALARDLGISQGHYSKVVDCLVSDKKHYIERGLRLLSPEKGGDGDIDALLQSVAREVRASAAFRRLVQAALSYSRRDAQ